MTSDGLPSLYPAYIPKGRKAKGDPILVNDDGCWIWQWDRSNPTPTLNHEGRKAPARRFVYEHEHGPIAADHRLKPNCGQSRCVNPLHMNQRRQVSRTEREANREALADERLDQFFSGFWGQFIAENEEAKSEARSLIRAHIGKQPTGGLDDWDWSDHWPWFERSLEVAEEEKIFAPHVLDAARSALETEEGKNMAERHGRLLPSIMFDATVVERVFD